MAYQSIRFYNFRNLLDNEVKLSEDVYYLVGENGAGKSSFLEGLYLLSYGSSFREKQLEHCLRQTDKPFALSGRVRQDSQQYEIQVQYERSSAGKKTINLDGKKLQDRKELLQIAPSIIFAHGDIAYIKGSPRDKRQFIDQTISLLEPSYVDLSRRYNRSLLQRNKIIKDKQLALLATYTLQMVESGLEIQQRRLKHIAQLSQTFSELFQYVSNFEHRVSIEYQASWPQLETDQTKEQALQRCLEYLEQRQQREVLLGSSQSGPQRDCLQFLVYKGENQAPLDFTKLASTGQLRLAALALKSTQANYLQQKAAYSSVLLLDDVLLEMDDLRRKLFLASLPLHQQVFFTLLPNENYQSYPFTNYQVLYLENGRLRE